MRTSVVRNDRPEVAGRVLPRWRNQELSPAAAWTLAFVALQQPVTLSEINAQRGGVDGSATLQTLRSRGLIARAAKLGPRRPDRVSDRLSSLRGGWLGEELGQVGSQQPQQLKQ